VNSYLMFQYAAHKNELPAGGDMMAENCLKNVVSANVKGWYLAKNTLTHTRAYDEAFIAKLDKYRKYLVTDEQRNFVSDYVLTINKTGAGQPAMPFDGTTPDGKKMSLADFKGKVVLVDVWATWCGPCRAQTPHLKKLADEMKGTDVAFLSYSIDDPKDTAKWKKMIGDENMEWQQLIGDAAFKSAICVNYKITAIPRFMLFDKQGKIVSIDAPRPSAPELKPLLEKYLK
jgi:thiol-disulfide isomerase/thioredoxin